MLDDESPTEDCSRVSVSSRSEIKPGILVTSSLLENIQEIMAITIRLDNLEKRYSIADMRNVNDASRLAQKREELQEANLSKERYREYARTMQKLHEALEFSCSIRHQLASEISEHQLRLDNARDELIAELVQLLHKGGLLKKPDIGSVLETDDFVSWDAKSWRSVDWADPTSPEQMPPPLPDPEAEKKAAAVEKLHQAKLRLQSTQLEFDQNGQTYEEELAAYLEQVEIGECETPRTEFDLILLMRALAATQDLVSAEDAFSQAAYEAMLAGAGEITSQQSACFVDHPGDNEGVANEAAQAIAKTDRGRIEKWMHAVDSDGDSQHESGTSEWEADPLAFGESCTMIAEGHQKVKIERWERMRKIFWQAMLDQGLLVLNEADSKVAAGDLLRGELDPTMPQWSPDC